jgi:very-short-patch-repair endonuclease
MSGTELRVWIRLRGRKLDGWKFRRQHPIGPYYVDFYCPAAKLVIEIDGPSHDDEWSAYDARRQAWLEAEGLKVIRFSVGGIDAEVVDVKDSVYSPPALRATSP